MSTTVLVVEDDLEINELMGEYLGLEGIKYLQALTGQAGIHLAGAHHPDAIILDLMLPDIDGFEVARAIASKRATFDVPIIVLSCMCQECDREKAVAAGALFFMNKPFLPDDLLATVREALAWKQNLRTRNPAGSILLGAAKDRTLALSKSIHQMQADLFARTALTDSAIHDIWEAIETLGTWAHQWNADHADPSHLCVEYRLFNRETGSDPRAANGSPGANASTIEWKLTEDAPGVLADAFFKPAPAASGIGGTLMGWGGTALLTKPVAPIAPPAKWLQVLAKTGAARFEKDSKTHTVRFARSTTTGNGAAPSLTGPVPVVEIDGTRYPTRLRDEALAAKRK